MTVQELYNIETGLDTQYKKDWDKWEYNPEYIEWLESKVEQEILKGNIL